MLVEAYAHEIEEDVKDAYNRGRLDERVQILSKSERVLVKLGVATALSGYPIKDGCYRVYREPVDGSEA